MVHWVMWMTILMVGAITLWALVGNGGIVGFDKPSLFTDIALGLLGLNLVIQHAINIVKRIW